MSDQTGNTSKKDKNYKRYEAAIDRALALFDSALQEWPDYIAFIGRLLKVLQSRPSTVSEVPRSPLVAKRLAQCLDPSLPSGVHQKALEVYVYVFSFLSRDDLGRELRVWLPGLAPTMSFASLSVRPVLLSLFEKHIVRLDAVYLRLASKSVILALLPGLEERNSEEYGRTLSILHQFKENLSKSFETSLKGTDASGDQLFWQSLFLASLSSPSRRQGVLAYLEENLPMCNTPLPSSTKNEVLREEKTNEIAAVADVTTPEPGLLVRCFATGLKDDQILIQRGFLDLLVSHLPLHCAVLHQKVIKGDRQKLVSAAASVVLRRDMSLNRRLWSWFLGPEPSIDPDVVSPTSPLQTSTTAASKKEMSDSVHYFENFGLDPLVDSLRDMLDDQVTLPSEKVRPFRICLSLMDRNEIGNLVLPAIFHPLMESLQRFEKTALSVADFEEVLRSANVFFDGVESQVIWDQINRALDWERDVPTTHSEISAHLRFVHFIVQTFNVHEAEMLQVHIPMTMLRILIQLRRLLASTPRPQEQFSETPAQEALALLIDILDKLPGKPSIERMETAVAQASSESFNVTESNLSCLKSIKEYYAGDQGDRKASQLPFPLASVGTLMLQNVMEMIMQAFTEGSRQEYIDLQLLLLDKLTARYALKEVIDPVETLGVLIKVSARIASRIETFLMSLTDVQSILTFLELIEPLSSTGLRPNVSQLSLVMHNLMRKVWAGLSPANAQCNVEAVRCLWRINSMTTEEHLVQGSLAHLMLHQRDASQIPSLGIDEARRFTILWAHTLSSTKGHPTHLHKKATAPLRRKSRRNLVVQELKVLSQPLCLLLDTLRSPNSQLGIFTSGWLSSITNTEVILDHLLENLMEILRKEGSSTDALVDAVRQNGDFDLIACMHNLQLISDLIHYSPANVWSSNALYPSLTDSKSTQEKQARRLIPDKTAVPPVSAPLSASRFLSSTCMYLLQCHLSVPEDDEDKLALDVRQAAIALIQQLLKSSKAEDLVDLDLETSVLGLLSDAICNSQTSVQLPLIQLLTLVMKAPPSQAGESFDKAHPRMTTDSNTVNAARTSLSLKRSRDRSISVPLTVPPALLECFILALTTPSAYPLLDHWVQFIDECLESYGGDTFQISMTLVDTFVKSILSVFSQVQSIFSGEIPLVQTMEPASCLQALLNGLERILARAHERLALYESDTALVKGPEPQGFFGNMVSGVMSTDPVGTKTATTNTRLTVLLCFKDAIRTCYTVWSWAASTQSKFPPASSASTNYISVRLRYRIRKLLEHLFAAEALECIETLVSLHFGALDPNQRHGQAVLTLLHVLDGSRPRNTVPAIFNSIYSRTNPAALDPSRMSSMTSELTERQLSQFLVKYVHSLEDDAMDEIWSDCTTFLRDVLANPMPQRQILPILLDFTATIGIKISRTNFGEPRKMRRDLGDLFIRMLTAVFTVKPLSFGNDVPPESEASGSRPTDSLIRVSDEIVSILATLLPDMSKIIIDTDRITAVSTAVSTHVIIPTIRSKTFPRNVDMCFLNLLDALSRIPEAAKTVRKDVSEAFNDARFVSEQTLYLWENGWLPVLRHWASTEKERSLEVMSRIPAPTSAGIMFGVGAAAARSEADRKAQLNLRRTALLILAANHDIFRTDLGSIQEKIVELLGATATSSPSSTTRADVYVLLRAIFMKVSPMHLSGFWPLINSELQEALSPFLSETSAKNFVLTNVLQACKLLETLLIIAPDDFQLHEWLFITDTVDAVYQPQLWTPSALIDGIAAHLNKQLSTKGPTQEDLISSTLSSKRRPLLTTAKTKGIDRDLFLSQVLHPFFQQLSITCFEASYHMAPIDREACMEDLLVDVFDDATLV